MLIDLNCDLGEGAGTEAELLPLITSANVSCGAHAGTEADIAATLRLAHRHGVAVGAHPGHPDPEHFGRRELRYAPRDVLEMTRAQITALRKLADEAGVKVRYVKPHGGLYHQACREDVYADAVVSACALAGLPVVGLPGSRLEIRAVSRVDFFAEGFADRRYRADGSLVPRDQPDAFVQDPREAVEQVRRLIAERGVRTICVHGDNPAALAFVRAVREELLRSGTELRPFA
ncbi:MAG TPA: 5-oxoprolinase subunit PxpA [Gemmataceae bacterium]|nr:5-oxoprolinase subunit PxpA [Gemmataceae bacterium]